MGVPVTEGLLTCATATGARHTCRHTTCTRSWYKTNLCTRTIV